MIPPVAGAQAGGMSAKVREWVRTVEEKVEEFVKTRPQFKQAAQDAFQQLDPERSGKVLTVRAASSVHIFFGQVQESLDEYGIKVKEPNPEELIGLIKESDIDENGSFTVSEFEEFYVKVLKYGAIKFAAGFTQKYGLGMLAGFFGVMLVKATLRSIPGVSRVTRPILFLFPSIIVGPVIGAAAVYGIDHGDLLAAKKRFFPSSKGQFKTG